MVTKQRMSTEMQQCIKDCEECAGICLETVQYCLEKGGEHANPEHIRLLQICAEICRTSAFFMHVGSDQHPQVCGACAEVCEACAASCEQFGDDAQMKRCAEICRRCAESCYAMAGQA